MPTTEQGDGFVENDGAGEAGGLLSLPPRVMYEREAEEPSVVTAAPTLDAKRTMEMLGRVRASQAALGNINNCGLLDRLMEELPGMLRRPHQKGAADSARSVLVEALNPREVVKAVREGLHCLGPSLYARVDPERRIVTLVDGPGPSRKWLGTTTLRRLREVLADLTEEARVH